MVLTVKSFLGFVDLKVSCIVLAAIRLIISIVIFISLLTWFLKEESKEVGIIEFAILVYSVVAAAVLVANILVTYWFIKGAIASNPIKMEYYIMVEVVVVVLCMHLLSFHLASIISAVVECYILLCSHSLYQECLISYSPENAVYTTENTAINISNVPAPPPLYNSCEQNTTQETQPQPTTANPFRE